MEHHLGFQAAVCKDPPDEVGGGKKEPSDLFPTLKRISICKKTVGNGTGEHMAKWPNV